jgi:beta-aspartyl-peptidase (threonine type)
MRTLTAVILALLPVVAAAQPAKGKPSTMLVMHGGAGTITRKSMTPEMETQYREALELALKTGNGVLAKGGSSLDAVEAAIRVLEDSPLFNAGKGAVFTHEGKNELDASIMDGKTRKAGAVAGGTIVRNPISAARAVMDKSKHVMMAGRGAELFATKMGLEIVDPSYFWTERRWKSLQEELLQEEKGAKPMTSLSKEWVEPKKFGTVGAVALDQAGNLAAGTSTGGMTNKQYGRVGDSPIIGAGTYADNATVAVSCTGDGEYFIRLGVARDIAALVDYAKMTVKQAGDEVIMKKLTALGGEGGAIVLDKNGNYAMPFNSEGMYRGWIGPDGVPHVLIYKD